MKLIRPILLLAACSLPLLATAQWQWIDKNGRKVFSDRPPPSDVKKVLKQPGAQSAGMPAAAAPAADPPAGAVPLPGSAAAAKPGASAPKVSGKDSELEAKKKKAEAAEAEKKKAEEEKLAKARAENCARAKQAKATMDSGVRMVTTNASGEREYMDDAARAAEARRIQSVIDADCK